MIFAAGNDKAVLIDGIPYPKDRIFASVVSPDQISIIEENEYPIPGAYPAIKYSEIINSATGLAFASMQALLDFVYANFYLSGGSSSAGGGFLNKTTVIASPTNTLTDPLFVNATIGDVMIINNIPLQWAIAGVPIAGVGITFTASTGTFNFTGYGGLLATTIITIYYKSA